MSEEEKKAIENAEKFMNKDEDNLFTHKDLKLILNLLSKKDKVIDLMVKEIATTGKSIEIINLYNNVSPDKPIYDLVKEYFYKKAEEGNDNN